MFLYPLAVSLFHVSAFGFGLPWSSYLILTVGFVYELAKGALDYAKASSSSKKYPKQAVFKSRSGQGLRHYSTGPKDSNASYQQTDGKRRRDKGNPKYSREYKAKLSFSTFQAEVLVGLL